MAIEFTKAAAIEAAFTDALDALRPDELGLLHRLAQCVRAVVEDMPEHESLPAQADICGTVTTWVSCDPT